MRPPIPVEDHGEVFRLMAEMLPSIDIELVEELARNYLLEAIVCLDFEDINYALIRPGLLLTGVSIANSASEFKKHAYKLIDDLLAKRLVNGAPSAALILVCFSPVLLFENLVDYINYVKENLPGATECFFGIFYAPDGAEVKTRIFLTGETDFYPSLP